MRAAHALLAWCVCACVGAITFEDNGYDDIRVLLPDDVPDEERQDLVDDLQKLFVASSRVLYFATKRRAHFRGVTLLLPPSWGDWGGNATYRYGGGEEAAEVALVARRQGAAEPPWALHHRGCGGAARRVVLPRGFLENGSMSWEEKGVPFVRAWAEFRYGVFPEGGFFSDARFPPYRAVPGATSPPLLRVTACADPEPQFLNRTQSGEECDPDTSESGLCMPYPDLHRMDRPPTSSIAYQQLQSHAPLFCEGPLNLGPRHDPRGPSKHNLVCEEESVWHVILRSPDFARGRNAATKYQPPPLRMRFVQQRTAPTIVVAVDVSSRMREQYAWARNGLARWISSDLPDGSRIALMSFAGSVELLSGFVELSAPRSRSELLESDLLPEEAGEVEVACVECAVLEAIQLLETYPETDTGGTVVLLTSTAELNVSSPSLSGRLSRSGIRLQAVLFGQTSGSGGGQEADGALSSLCAGSGGALVALPDDGGPDLMYRGMAGLLQEYDSVIAQEWLTPSHPTLSFYLDEGSSNDVRVILGNPGFDPFDPPLVAGQTTLSDGGATYTAIQRLEFAAAWRFALPSSKAGEFVLETSWREKAGDVPVLVTVQARPDSAGAIRARLWFEHIDVKIDPFAVLVFVEVRSGSFPVAGAAVSVSVRHPGSDSVSSFDQLDDGNTTPDMTEGDGIYSRTFSNISESGFYTLTAEVTGENSTFILLGPASDCCGSRFPHAEASRRSTGPFRRLLGPVSLAAPRPPPAGDVHPPGRIADLDVHLSYRRVFVVTWSATGGDHENGHAAQYELKLSSDRTQLRRNFDSLSPSSLIESPDAVPYGATLFHTYLVPDHVGRGTHFLGMRAVDEAGNAGPVSNTVEVWIEGSGKEEPVRCGVRDVEPKQEEYNSARPAVSSSADYLLRVIAVVFVFLL